MNWIFSLKFYISLNFHSFQIKFKFSRKIVSILNMQSANFEKHSEGNFINGEDWIKEKFFEVYRMDFKIIDIKFS
jgi:hypothetical protein